MAAPAIQVLDLAEDATREAPCPRVAWEAHDRTHLEASVVVPLEQGERRGCGWEAYFLVPETFQLPGIPDLPGLFRTRVRRAVPGESFATLAGAPMAAVERALEAGEGVERRLRLFACLVKRTVVSTLSELRSRLDDPAGPAEARLQLKRAETLVRDVHTRLGEVAGEHRGACQHADEAISLSIEGFFHALAVALDGDPARDELASRAASGAVAEARYRLARGFESVVEAPDSARAIERYAQQRHRLKRHASSVLWLTMRDSEPRRWARHVLYGLAAGTAMAFAVAAAMWNGASPADRLSSWLFIAVLAYVGKDRIKASLQGYLGNTLLRRLPNHRWTLRDPDGDAALGVIDEHTRLVDWDAVPADVQRCQPAVSADGDALGRAPHVLLHTKEMALDGRTVHRDDELYRGVVEVCRVDLSSWLAHTDDPKRDVHFADPVGGDLMVQKAPRVYDVVLCFRAWGDGSPATGWQQLRVVVSRKGILRLEPLDRGAR